MLTARQVGRTGVYAVLERIMEVVIFHTLELPERSAISVPPLWKNASEDDRADLLNAVVSALGTHDPTVVDAAVAVLAALARTPVVIAFYAIARVSPTLRVSARAAWSLSSTRSTSSSYTGLRRTSWRRSWASRRSMRRTLSTTTARRCLSDRRSSNELPHPHAHGPLH